MDRKKWLMKNWHSFSRIFDSVIISLWTSGGFPDDREESRSFLLLNVDKKKLRMISFWYPFTISLWIKSIYIFFIGDGIKAVSIFRVESTLFWLTFFHPRVILKKKKIILITIFLVVFFFLTWKIFGIFQGVIIDRPWYRQWKIVKCCRLCWFKVQLRTHLLPFKLC